MSNWIRIKKARALRNRLIAVMYLLFISLSVINIPIDWLHINKYMAPLLTETTIVSIDNEELRTVYERVEQIKEEFYSELGYDESTGKYREPFGYSVTDNFFITRERGTLLQDALKEVHAHLDELGEEKAELFNALFEEDLENGLLDEGTNWITWKFKHVPAAMAETLLNELVLRVRLISGDLEFRGNQPSAEASGMVKYATNLDFMVLGDTLTIVPANQGIVVEARRVNESNWQPLNQDSLQHYFVPASTGAHNLRLISENSEEQFTFTVLPARINRRGAEAFLTYFKGQPATVSIGTVISGGSVSCSCDDDAVFRSQQLQFTPTNTGWCSFEVRGANNAMLLRDSVYVQSTPQPLVKVKGLLDGERLPKGTAMVALEAFHPNGQGIYDIQEITYEKLTGTEGEQKASGATINLNGYQGAIWIKNITTASGDQTFETEGNFLITIDA